MFYDLTLTCGALFFKSGALFIDPLLVLVLVAPVASVVGVVPEQEPYAFPTAPTITASVTAAPVVDSAKHRLCWDASSPAVVEELGKRLSVVCGAVGKEGIDLLPIGIWQNWVERR